MSAAEDMADAFGEPIRVYLDDEEVAVAAPRAESVAAHKIIALEAQVAALSAERDEYRSEAVTLRREVQRLIGERDTAWADRRGLRSQVAAVQALAGRLIATTDAEEESAATGDCGGSTHARGVAMGKRDSGHALRAIVGGAAEGVQP